MCLNTANTDGKLIVKMNELIIPYNIEKIVRDTKYFDFDTVAVALDLYKKLGLIYEAEDNILRISHFDEMVGSESASAKRVRECRERQKALQCNTDVTQEYRDKIKDNKSIDNIITHKYECHLKKLEKDSFCLDCQKKNVCDKKTSDKFITVFGCTLEEFINKQNKPKEKIIIEDFDWLNNDEREE